MKALSREVRTSLLVLTLVGAAFVGLQTSVSLASATPYSGSPPSPTNLTLYYHNLTAPVTIGSQQLLDIADTWNDTVPQYANLGSNLSASHYLSLNFTVFPQLSGPLYLNGTVYSWIYLTQSGSAPTGGSVRLTAFEVSPGGTASSLGTGPATLTGTNYPGTSPTSVMLTGPTLNITVPANDSLSFLILVSGNTGETYSALWGNFQSTYYYSRASVSASSYLDIGSMYALNSTGQPVYSLSQSASNKTIGVFANLTDPFGLYDFSTYPVDYSVAYANGTVLAAGVMAAEGSYDAYAYSRVYTFSLNYSSVTSGSLIVTVNGTDNTMHNYLAATGVQYGRNAFGTLQLFIGTPPITVNFTVTDAAANPVPGAAVRIFQLSFLVGSSSTNGNGLAAMSLSSGNYTADVYWQSVSVGSFSVSVSSNSTNFTLRAHIYSPVFTFDDQSGTPLSFAQVELTSPAGSRLPLAYSSSNGSLQLNEMAGGEYRALVYWHGSTVFNGTISFDSNGIIAVDVSAYMQSFKVVSEDGSAVATANIIVVNSTTGIYAGFNTTNASGSASSVVPYGIYNIEVFWKGIQVYGAANVMLNNPAAGTMTLNASIYDVTVRAVSSSGSSLSGVIVTVYSPTTGAVLSAVTGSNGQATFTVAAGNYTLTSSYSTTFDLTPVSQQISQSLNVSQPTSLTLRFTKVYPAVTSTNLFYVIVVLVVVIAAAAAAVMIVLRRRKA